MEGKIVCFSAADNHSRANFKKTVLNCIDLNDLETKFFKIDKPSNIQHVSIWGARSEKLWNELNTNDVILFYANYQFISYGTLMCKIQSKEIAEYLWDEKAYKNLVIMSPHVKIGCSREKFWKAFNYADKFYILGLRIPFVKRQKEIVSEYGSIQAFLEYALDLDKMDLPNF
ncbi:hypothetical protein ACIFOT_14165 [Neobacillus sp. NRS-1170]|uniref:hypothetical protein n=1 Tax=Neobacillus sp. NRS-1170 TaxID=3233898 RepID=UPI003D2E01A4